MDAETFLFRKFLYQISNHLSSGDVQKLQFMLDDDLPRAQLEAACSGFDIFCLMEEKNLLSKDDLDFLKDILDTVSKAHYIERYQAARGSAGEVLKQVPSVSSGSHTRTRGGASAHKKFLSSLGDEMSAENVRDMALFFHGATSSIHVRDLDGLKSAEKIFKKLDSSRSIQPGDYIVLYNVLDVLGRQDLCEMIEEHCKKQGSEPGTPQERDDATRTHATLQAPVPAEDQDQPSTYAPSTGTYTSRQSTSTEGSTMESRAGSAGQLVYRTGQRRLASNPHMDGVPTPGLGADHHLQQQILQLQHEKQGLEEDLAAATKQAQYPSDRTRVHQLEGDLQKKIQEVQQLQEQIKKLPKTDRPPSYEMNHTPHGVAIVIVNERFDKNPLKPDTQLTPRNGAKKDLKYFKETFEHLTYHVKVYENLPANEMLGVLNEAAGMDHSNYDSFVCCVSTHGDSEGLYSSDSVLVTFAEIQTPLRQCPSLNGKPKLFFFQSCRSKHPYVTADNPGSPGHEDKDMYTVFAATPFRDAFISPDYGSWLAHAMYRYFTNPQLVFTENLGTLVNYVCEEVGKQVGLLLENGQPQEVRQCVQKVSTLTKKVYFVPPQQMQI